MKKRNRILLFSTAKKLLLILLIAIFTMLFGCVNNEAQNISTETPSITEEGQNSVINILMPVNQYKPMYENISIWQDILKDKYDIELNLKYVQNFDSFAIGTYISDEINNGYSGLIHLWDWTDTKTIELAKSGEILPLTQYMMNNEVFNSFPIGMTDRYKLEDNEIWGIPVMYSVTPMARVTKKDWLTNLDMEVPATVTELYNMFKAFTYDDPNNSGEDDTFGLSVYKKCELGNLGDIFLANACYIDPYGYSSISFDRETNTYEDAFLKSGARISFDMIASMVDEKMINTVDYSSTFAFEEENDGSFYYFVNGIGNLDKVTIIWYVEGTNNENLCRANTGAGCYVLSKNTEKPQEVIDTFINTFYGSPEGYYMAFGGIKEIDYKVDGKKYISIAGKNAVRILERYTPYLKSNGYSWVNENNEIISKNCEFLTEGTEILYNMNKLYFTSLLDTPFGTDLNNYSKQMVSSLIAGDINVNDLLSEYRTHMKMTGTQDMIDSENEALGKTTNFHY